MRGFSIAAAAVLVAAMAGHAAPALAQTAELRVLSSNGVKAVVEDLQAQIERAVGRPLSIEFSTAASLKQKIEAGEAFDVALLTPALIDDLVNQNRIVADSRANFARAGVGVGARTGTPKPEVGTLDALRRTLLEAESVAFTADGQSRITVDKAFERLGIAEAMRDKTILMGPGRAPAAVAAGEAEIVLTLISEILPVAGLQLVGPFPAQVQGYVAFAAGRSPAARDVDAAQALIRYLSAPEFIAALETHGMESVPP